MSNDLLRVESLHKHFKVGHKRYLGPLMESVFL